MTTIDVKLISKDACKPSPIVSQNGVYFQLKAATEIEINPGELRVVDSGLEIKIPRGYRLVMVCGPSALEKNLLINQQPEIGKFSPYLESQNPRLTYMVYNAGKSLALIRNGDPLGRFVLDRTAIGVDIRDVDSFDENVIEPKFNTIVEIPKTEDSYFKRLYRQDKDKCIDMFLTNNDGTKILEDLENYKQNDDYSTATNQKLLEAQFVWKALTDSIREEVVNKFNDIRKRMIKKSRED